MLDPDFDSLLQSAADTLPIPFAILDADGTILDVNESWKQLTLDNGLAPSKSNVGRNYLAIAEEGGSQSASNAAAGIRALLEGEQDTFEMEFPCHSPNENRWFLLKAASFDRDGARFVSVAHVDITDRKRREQELELYEGLLENQRGVALLFDEDGKVLLANERALEITGLSESDVVGKSHAQLPKAIAENIDPFEDLQGMLAEVLNDGLQFASTEVEFETVDGERMIAEVRMTPFEIDEYSQGAIMTARDITEWLERDKMLRLYERAVEGSSEMLAAVDREFEYLFANEAYREFHDLSPDEIEDTTIFDVIDRDLHGELRQMVKRVLEGESIEYMQDRTGPNGTNHPLDIRYYPLRKRDGSIIGAVGALRNVSEQKKRERQLLVLDRVLRHNMHNHMNVIEGYASTIEELTDGTIEDYANTVVTNAEDLLTTVDKLRDITELLSKPHRIQSIDITNTVRTVVQETEASYPDADIQVSAPGNLHVLSIFKIERAIAELLENAVKHVDDRIPEVEIRLQESEEWVQVRVADNGPGIPRAERDVLRGKRDIEPLYHGSGMGLWLVNWIVSRSEGHLRFEEYEPRGSEVIIVLPKDIPRERTA